MTTPGGGQSNIHTNDKTHGLDSKLRPKEWKCHQENNLCMICGKGDHRVGSCTAYAKGWASQLKSEDTQTPPELAEQPQAVEPAETPKEEQGN